MVTLATFALGFIVASVLDWWLRDRVLSHVGPRCGCGRETAQIVKRVRRAWGLCSWCASSCDIAVRGDLIAHIAEEVRLT